MVVIALPNFTSTVFAVVIKSIHAIRWNLTWADVEKS